MLVGTYWLHRWARDCRARYKRRNWTEPGPPWRVGNVATRAKRRRANRRDQQWLELLNRRWSMTASPFGSAPLEIINWEAIDNHQISTLLPIQSFSNQKLTDCNSVAENSDGGDDRQQYLCGWAGNKGNNFFIKKRDCAMHFWKLNRSNPSSCHHSRLKLGRTIQEMEPHFKKHIHVSFLA